MGAEFDSCEITAKTDTEAQKEFAKEIAQAAYDYGHAGYTGTFAEKTEVDILPPPNGRKYWTKEELESHAGEISKWDNAIGGKINENTYFIAGWCSA